MKQYIIDELREKNPDLLKALYLLAFKEYEGFDKIKQKFKRKAKYESN